MSAPAAGWYADPSDATKLRYWDGAQWTDHTQPAPPPQSGAPVGPPITPLPAESSYGVPPPPAAAPAGVVAPAGGSWWSRQTRAARIGLIAGAVLVTLVVLGSIGRGLSGSEVVAESTPIPAATVTVTATPEPAATLTTAPPVAPAPAPAPVVDAAGFRTQAASHLDDMLKDLDDMVVTLDENGFFRLISNSSELSFNIGQLQGLEVPSSVTELYAAGLTQLETTVDEMTTAIGNQDSDGLRALIDRMRGEIEAVRATVNSAI